MALTMRIGCAWLATVLVGASVLGASSPTQRRVTSAHTPWAGTEVARSVPPIVRLYQEYDRSRTNCHPSRQSAIDEYGRRIHHLTSAERREIQKGHAIVANYKKYQAQQAKRKQRDEVKLAVERAWRESRDIIESAQRGD